MKPSEKKIVIYPGVPAWLAAKCVDLYMSDALRDGKMDKTRVASLIHYTMHDGANESWYSVNVYQGKTQVIVRGEKVTDPKEIEAYNDHLLRNQP